MNEEQALTVITTALSKVLHGDQPEIELSTDLVEDKVLDSLDSMNFLYELEEELGSKLEAIDEEYADFKVSALVDIIKSATAA